MTDAQKQIAEAIELIVPKDATAEEVVTYCQRWSEHLPERVERFGRVMMSEGFHASQRWGWPLEEYTITKAFDAGIKALK